METNSLVFSLFGKLQKITFQKSCFQQDTALSQKKKVFFSTLSISLTKNKPHTLKETSHSKS
jgi:hypothetical protein